MKRPAKTKRGRKKFPGAMSRAQVAQAIATGNYDMKGIKIGKSLRQAYFSKMKADRWGSGAGHGY